ncbi:MAG: hypothetical protein H6Q23_725 [Bacteroidetes bacterium]|nr:hypothetical protein [Bacteroidota bacterium]
MFYTQKAMVNEKLLIGHSLKEVPYLVAKAFGTKLRFRQ